MKKRISFFIFSLNGGGSERVLINIANGLCKRGYEVEFIVVRNVGDYISQVDKRIKIVNLNARRAKLSIFDLVKYLRNNKTDVLITPWCHLNIIGYIAKKVSGSSFKNVFTEHTVSKIDIDNSGKLQSIIMPKLMKYFYPKANSVVAVSNGVAEGLSKYLKMNRGDIEVIYNPLIDNDFNKLADEEVEHEWFVKKNNPIIISVGRLSYSKDFSTLIKAFAIVRIQVQAKLVILGEGEEREKLEKLAEELNVKEYVWMPGFVDNPHKYVAKADVFAFASMWEGLGNVVVEALACNTPVISADCPIGPREILQNGKYGILVEVGNVEMMAKRLIESFSTAKNFDYDEAISRFKFNRNIEEYVRVIEK